MIEDLKKFQLDLTHFHEIVVPETHAKLCGRIAFRLHQYVVAGSPGGPGTPVDTGWARANWAVKVGWTCPTEPIGTYPGKGNKTDLPVFNAAGAVFTLPKYPFIWVYNNVPYIEALEDGHSGQAPTGVLSGALNSIQTFVDSL